MHVLQDALVVVGHGQWAHGLGVEEVVPKLLDSELANFGASRDAPRRGSRTRAAPGC